MPYTLYRNKRITDISSKQVTPLRRPQDIVDPHLRRDRYTVMVATIDGLPGTVTFGDFEAEMRPGDYVSVAVGSKWNVIAVVNHTTGQSACLTYRNTRFSEYFGILFFISIPAVLSYFIARNAFHSANNPESGWYILGAGALIVVLILAGINKQYTQSKAALRKLQAM
jgi:hypothetical protein